VVGTARQATQPRFSVSEFLDEWPGDDEDPLGDASQI